MPNYSVHPKAPLLFRDARPFGGGDTAETLAFPLPSTLAGAFRTAYGDAIELDFSTQADQLLDVDVHGPILQEINSVTQQSRLLIPTPADALCLAEEDEQGDVIYRLTPQELKNGGGCDLPHPDLLPVFPNTESMAKPKKDAAKFWYLDDVVDWLTDDSLQHRSAENIGRVCLPVETRTHVAIGKHFTAEDGRLFQTSGLDFSEQWDEQHKFWSPYHYALSIHSSAKLDDVYRRVGGEGRLAEILRQDDLWPTCPESLAKALATSKGLRIQLVTPAIFDHGWRPSWLDKSLTGELHGLTLKLRAMAVPRWQPVSGWDMRPGKNSKQQRGQRPVQRMAPAGSVYWFEIQGNASAATALWLRSVSDQRNQDGFGLALPGVWHPESISN